jgi:hypothetical protein
LTWISEPELMMQNNLDAAKILTLHVFDEEFGQDDSASQLSKTRSTLLAVVLIALIFGGQAAVAWSTTNGGIRLQFASAPAQPRNTEREGSPAVDPTLPSALKSRKNRVRGIPQRLLSCGPGVDQWRSYHAAVSVHTLHDRAGSGRFVSCRDKRWKLDDFG